ncbi:carbohydrate esterase family 3 protein [Parathielavia appendiculata]|uniref:Carbohydrate esterase family 3 protein n=1 Tax=Parathielavia appendiculata TaxID=2587402 RepID=A0AAN6U646_9PEZI|nr:carbohydrate esterase family 3 protein [Parathielavia appendiculata]
MVVLNTLMLALAVPLTAQPVSAHPSTTLLTSRAPLGNGVALRIMPLGASITYGTASSDGSGYRAALRAHIVSAATGNKVNMVGSRQSSTMADNDVEGWPGLRVEQVRKKARASVPQWKPNVVLVNAGTNDALQGWNVSSAGERMEEMVRGVWEDSPRAVVVLSTLVVNQQASVEQNVEVINRQYRKLAARLRGEEGRRIVLAEMHGEKGPVLEDLADGIHPTDHGYRIMAELWFAALVEASQAGLLQAPEPVEGVPDDGAA